MWNRRKDFTCTDRPFVVSKDMSQGYPHFSGNFSHQNLEITCEILGDTLIF